MLDRQPADSRRAILTVVGSLMILAGGILLVALGLMVVEIVRHPEEVAIVGFVSGEMDAGAAALSGHVADMAFSLSIGEPLRTLLFLVLVIWILGVVASILKTLVVTGRSLISGHPDPD